MERGQDGGVMDRGCGKKKEKKFVGNAYILIDKGEELNGGGGEEGKI